MSGKRLIKDQGTELRRFKSGATRDTDQDKLDYEGFLSPIVLERFAQYMHKHRKLPDGAMRASDNWQLGIPNEELMKSLMRHVFTVWLAHRREEPLPQDELCAIIFNTQGLLLDILKETKNEEVSRSDDAGVHLSPYGMYLYNS